MDVEKKPNIRKIRRLTNVISLIVLVAAWLNGNVNPIVHIPTVIVPSPNAYDDFMAALALYSPDDHNIVDNAQVVTIPGSGNLLDIDGAALPIAVQDQIAARNVPVLARIRVGLTCSFLAPPIRNEAALNAIVSHDNYSTAKFRSLARLCRFEGLVAARHGDWEAATDDDILACELGAKTMQGASSFAALTGFSCDSIGRQDIWYYVDHLDSEDAFSAASRLEAVEAARPTVAQTFSAEKWDTESGLVAWYTHDLSKNIASDPFSPGLETLSYETGHWSTFRGRTEISVGESLLFTISPKHVAIARYSDYMDRWIALSKLPYRSVILSPEPRDLSENWSLMLLAPDSNREFEFLDTDDTTNARLLITALALRAYYLDHAQAYPNSLGQLVPRYLNFAPLDPFADNMTLRYRNKGATYLLYSIGPDGIDNRGKPFVNIVSFTVHGVRKTRPVGNWCRMDTKGDIVAGVNRG